MSCFFSDFLQMKRDREQKAKKAQINVKGDEGGEFDDLVSALRSGEVFDKNLSRMIRKKHRRQETVNDNRERPATKLNQ